MDKKRITAAVLIAPFASLAVVLGMAAESLLYDSRMLSFDGLMVFGLMALGFVSTSFVFVLLVGVPIHWLLTKIKINSVLWYIAMGVSFALAYVHLKSPEDIPQSHLQTSLLSYGVTAVFVSWCFWYVAVKTHNKALKSGTPQNGAP